MNWILATLAATLTLLLAAMFVGALLFVALMDITGLTLINEARLMASLRTAKEKLPDSPNEAYVVCCQTEMIVDNENSRLRQLHNKSWLHRKVYGLILEKWDRMIYEARS